MSARLAALRRLAVAAVWNAAERRLRAPWRLLLGAVVLAAATFVPALAASVLAGLLLGAVPDVGLGSWLPGIAASAVTTVLGVYLAGRFLDRRRFTDFGLRLDRSFRADLGFGLALGAGLMTAIFLVELAAGWIAVADVGDPGSVAPAVAEGFVAFALVGIYEELLVRGYLLKNVLEGFDGFGPLGTRAAAALAALLSAAVFGLLHAGNPNATLVSTVTIGVAGLVFALAYLLTGDLGVPIGLHVTWNFFQRTVYGFPVSGARIGGSVVAIRQRGPRPLTGGAFGPEAGLVGLGALLVAAAAIAARTYRRRGELSLAPGVEDPDLRRR